METVEALRNDHDHAAALQEIEGLWNVEPGTLAAERLELLASLVEAYESERWPSPILDPIQVIEAVMSALGLNGDDFGDVIGSATLASAILERRQPLTAAMIHAINAAWSIPVEVLGQEYELAV